MLDEYGDFKEEYGIYSILNHRSSEFFHFSAMLGVQPGETVEFYTLDGEPAVINAETKETQSATPAEGPSVGVAPSGTWI